MLSSKEIEKQIEKYQLKFLQVRDERIEWLLKFPMFVPTFLKLVEQNNFVPSQDEFVERYLADNAAELAQQLTSPQLKTGLEARLRRTYPSVVRDLHFEALLREHGLDVVYNPATDIQGGVDHMIKYKGTTFQLHCYTHTRAGQYARRVKNRRHKFQGIHLDVQMELGSDWARKVGDFYLYSDKHVESVIAEMESKLRNTHKANNKSAFLSGKN
jgi:hypothetical protein